MSAAARTALEACKAFLEGNVAHHGYGFFPGGDPRNFHPDPECTTASERDAHRLACERASIGTPSPEDSKPGGGAYTDADEKVIGFWDGGSFGMGSYTIRDPEIDALLVQVNAALAQPATPPPEGELRALRKTELAVLAAADAWGASDADPRHTTDTAEHALAHAVLVWREEKRALGGQP